MADLLTLAEYKALEGIPAANTSKDAQITALLPAVSAAIRNYTERDFGAVLVTEIREFQYDGSGYLDIDDTANIYTVSAAAPNTPDVELSDTVWLAQPPLRDDSPVYSYLWLPQLVFGSPEMGFEWNLDLFVADGRLWGWPQTIKIDAEWGWPVVPSDVKLATSWTIAAWLSNPDSGGDALTSESIESYSRSWGVNTAIGASQLALPSTAIDLLYRYTKVHV